MAVARGRGRPRARKATCPPHIDAGKVPDYCYWDPKGSGHWYTIYRNEDGKQRRRKIAGQQATLADLHKAMEEANGRPTDCLVWLASQFEASPQYPKVGSSNEKDYAYCLRVASAHPTKKAGITMGQIPLSAWTPALVQKLIDGIGVANGPSTAKHVNTYLKRLFNWAKRRGHFTGDNPAVGTELPEERKQQRLPDPDVVRRLSAFARERGALPDHTKGSCPHYIWMALEICYLNRLRGIEAFRSTDAEILEEGFYCRRTKGSRDSVTIWNPRLREVVSAAQEARRGIWGAARKPVPLDPKKRLLLVGTEGQRISSSTWQSAWRRFMTLAVDSGVITSEQRFGLHDMKRRGITDTRGTKADKMDAGGHKSPAMLDVYDKSVPVVKATAD